MQECYKLDIYDLGRTTVKVDRPDVLSPNGPGIVLGHGLHNSLDFPLLEKTAAHLASIGYPTVRFNFLFREAGLDRPDRPENLVACLRAVCEDSVSRWSLDPGRLFVGGKSLGAMTSARAVGQGFPALGLIFLGFPLHRPGDPSQVRRQELEAIQGTPQLFVEGTRDPHCQIDTLKAVLAELAGPARLVEVPGGDHAYLPLEGDPRSVDGIYTEIAGAVGQWIGEILSQA